MTKDQAAAVEAEARRFVSAYENHELSPEGEKAMRFARAIVERSASADLNMEAVEAARRIVAILKIVQGKRMAISFRDAETAERVGSIIENAGKVARAFLSLLSRAEALRDSVVEMEAYGNVPSVQDDPVWLGIRERGAKAIRSLK